MRWVDALDAALAVLTADTELLAALGGAHVYRMGASREPRMPSVEWFVVSTAPGESTQVLRTQWDLWAPSMASALMIETRLRALLDHRRIATLGGVQMWVRLEDARDLPDPEPGVIHRLLEFVFEPVRED